MGIFGIGTDIVKVSRINKLIINKKFLKRLFNKDEIKKCNKSKNTSSCYAKRFAAKEAFSKALGTGISKGLSFNEIIILNENSGKPFIKLHGKAKKIFINLNKNPNTQIEVSLSDEKKYAIANVIIYD